MKRLTLLALLLLGSSQAITVKLRPQGPEMQKLVLEALAAISSPQLPIALNDKAGPLLFLGGSAPFNPDVLSRSIVADSERRIEFNPKGPLPLAEALRRELTRELNIKEWTPRSARIGLSGADVNDDGEIDLSDLAILMENYGKSGSNTKGDINQDLKVDDLDIRIFSREYQP